MQLNPSKMIVFGLIMFVVIILLSIYSFKLTMDVYEDYKTEEKYERFKISSIEETS